MRDGGDRWALVLAGGSGTRLRTLTSDGAGAAVPKQYCSLSGGPSLLEEALGRARSVVPTDRIVVVAAWRSPGAASRPMTWWKPGVVIARIAGLTSGPRPPVPTRTSRSVRSGYW